MGPSASSPDQQGRGRVNRMLVGHRDDLSVSGHKHGEGIESEVEPARGTAVPYLPGLPELCKIGWLGRSPGGRRPSFPAAGRHQESSFAEATTASHLLPEDTLQSGQW